MNTVLLGHILQLIGILFACLAALFAFLFYTTVKKGRLAKCARYMMIGIVFLTINVFILYTGAITGAFNLLRPTLIWPLSGSLTFLGFGFIIYANLQMIKIIKKQE